MAHGNGDVGALRRGVPTRSLSGRARVGLDLARAGAALYVVTHHVAAGIAGPGKAVLPLRFGQEAVIVFFVLSGFVIFAQERSRALRPSGYLLRRFRRIYPGLLVAMVVSSVVALATGRFAGEFEWGEAWGNLLALQDLGKVKPGVEVNPFLGNEPLWSISYEVVFYLVFPVLLRCWLKRPALVRVIVGGVSILGYLLYLAHPNHIALVAAYLVIWWSGAMAAAAYLDGGRLFFRDVLPEGFFLLLLLCGALLGMVVNSYQGFGSFPFLMLRHFLSAGVVLAVLASPTARRLLSVLAVRIGRPVTAFASISYGIYLVHWPIVVDTEAYRGPWLIGALGMVVAVAIVIDRLLPKVLPPAPRD